MSSQQLVLGNIILKTIDPHFKNAAIATDIVYFTIINNELNILLIKRADDEFQTAFPGYWALPGKLLDDNETLEDCARKALKVKTGVHISKIRHFKNYSSPKRDIRQRTISVAYLAFNNSSEIKLKAGTDASDAEWFNISELPKKLAFDHRTVIKDGHETLLQNLMIEPNIIFPFLDDLFTIEDVRKILSSITKFDDQHKINLKINDRGNFHRWFTNLDLITETDEKEQNVSHKPAKLYRIKDK